MPTDDNSCLWFIEKKIDAGFMFVCDYNHYTSQVKRLQNNLNQWLD